MFLAARFADVVDGTPRVAFLQELPPEEVGSPTQENRYIRGGATLNPVAFAIEIKHNQ